MKFEIKNRWNGEVIFSIETSSFKIAVEAAIKSKADLRAANLGAADLGAADLSYANLRAADLRAADLSDADLRDADLRAANLPSPTMLLLAWWGYVTDDLCKFLMRYDASNHDDPEAFNRWADGGKCPYEGKKFQRSARFNEKKNLWSAELLKVPAKSAYELMQMLIAEKCKNK